MTIIDQLQLIEARHVTIISPGERSSNGGHHGSRQMAAIENTAHATTTKKTSVQSASPPLSPAWKVRKSTQYVLLTTVPPAPPDASAFLPPDPERRTRRSCVTDRGAGLYRMHEEELRARYDTLDEVDLAGRSNVKVAHAAGPQRLQNRTAS